MSGVARCRRSLALVAALLAIAPAAGAADGDSAQRPECRSSRPAGAPVSARAGSTSMHLKAGNAEFDAAAAAGERDEEASSREHYEAALRHYWTAVQPLRVADRRVPNLLVLMGTTYLRLEKRREALSCYKEALQEGAGPSQDSRRSLLLDLAEVRERVLQAPGQPGDEPLLQALVYIEDLLSDDEQTRRLLGRLKELRARREPVQRLPSITGLSVVPSAADLAPKREVPVASKKAPAPVYRRPWFWITLGSVAVAGAAVTTALLLTRPWDSPLPLPPRNTPINWPDQESLGVLTIHSR